MFDFIRRERGNTDGTEHNVTSVETWVPPVGTSASLMVGPDMEVDVRIGYVLLDEQYGATLDVRGNSRGMISSVNWTEPTPQTAGLVEPRLLAMIQRICTELRRTVDKIGVQPHRLSLDLNTEWIGLDVANVDELASRLHQILTDYFGTVYPQNLHGVPDVNSPRLYLPVYRVEEIPKLTKYHLTNREIATLLRHYRGTDDPWAVLDINAKLLLGSY